MELVIVTGMSGAGKSKVVDALEDLGFFCIDNVPPKLINTFVKIISSSVESYSKVAIVTDMRSGRHFDKILEYLKELDGAGFKYKIIFADADDDTLIRRYKETRRVHPLLSEYGGSLSKSVAMERMKLSSILGSADYYIDTTNLTDTQCKQKINEMILGTSDKKINIHCMSFGFKYGVPSDIDLLFDVRCLPNPFYVPELKHLTGLDSRVSSYVMNAQSAQELFKKITDLIDFLMPLYKKEGKGQLVIGFGCTGGRHRSVTFTQMLKTHLESMDYSPTVSHRDISK